jgi:flagellar biogenesis protein FliO
MTALATRWLDQIRRFRVQPRARIARLVEVQSFGAATKLAVVEFGNQRLLLSVAREGIRLLASDARP